MCGIIGKFNFNQKPVTETEILNMTKKLEHRGPDDQGVFINGAIGLGHRRLSIIDLSQKAHQPMQSRSGRYLIVFNGEIYNFKEQRQKLEKDGVKFISRSDTEVILYLYEKHGPDCLQYLSGMFAFAIYDQEKQEIFLARDRVGKKPLKYYHDKNTFIFASELKAILANPEVKKNPDWEAISAFLTHKYVPAPRTGFADIYKLPPAHYLIINAEGEKTIQRYWNLDFSNKLSLSEADWQKKITSTLRRAVEKRLISDVPLGAHLSGGVDSSLIVALMAQASKKPVKTFSIGFKEKKYNELDYARLVAEKYKTDHSEFIVEPKAGEILPELAYLYEEPYADASMLPTWHLAKITKERVTVALNGDGGDENFAGYERYRAARLYLAFKRLPLKKISALVNNMAYRASGREIFFKASRQLSADYKSLSAFYLSIIAYFSASEQEKLFNDYSLTLGKNFDKNPYWMESFNSVGESANDNLDDLLLLGIKTHLPDDLLVKTDIASMAHGLELRSPFLDHEFMELCASLPADYKLRRAEPKYLLKKIAAEYLPRECVYRPKQGFSVPLEFWFKGELNNFLRDNILSKDFLAYGFREKYIKDLLNDGNRNENKLFALLMLSLWLKQWFR